MLQRSLHEFRVHAGTLSPIGIPPGGLGTACAMLVLACGAGAQTPQQEPQVLIEGGGGTGTVFTWRVMNRGSVPIRYFEVPYHWVNRFEDPEGWASEGGKSKTGYGVYKAHSTDERYDIQPGRSLTFRCVMRERGAVTGSVTAKIGFRDGRVIEVPDVAAPVADPVALKWGTPVVLGGCVAIAAIWGMIHRRKARRAEAGPS